MSTLHTWAGAARAWLAAHDWLVYVAITLALNRLFRARTAAQWETLKMEHTRLAGLITILRGLGAYWPKIRDGAFMVLTGRPPPGAWRALDAELGAGRVALQPPPLLPSERDTPTTPSTPEAKQRASRSAIALGLACALLGACDGLRDAARRGSVDVAIAADHGGVLILAQRCSDQMRALGRRGVWRDGHCLEDGPRAGTPATAVEREALARVRTAWAPVVAAHNEVVSAQVELTNLLERGTDATSAQGTAAVGRLSRATAELRRVAAARGVDLSDAGAGRR